MNRRAFLKTGAMLLTGAALPRPFRGKGPISVPGEFGEGASDSETEPPYKISRTGVTEVASQTDERLQFEISEDGLVRIILKIAADEGGAELRLKTDQYLRTRGVTVNIVKGENSPQGYRVSGSTVASFDPFNLRITYPAGMVERFLTKSNIERDNVVLIHEIKHLIDHIRDPNLFNFAIWMTIIRKTLLAPLAGAGTLAGLGKLVDSTPPHDPDAAEKGKIYGQILISLIAGLIFLIGEMIEPEDAIKHPDKYNTSQLGGLIMSDPLLVTLINEVFHKKTSA